jgi:hypothetical protein
VLIPIRTSARMTFPNARMSQPLFPWLDHPPSAEAGYLEQFAALPALSQDASRLLVDMQIEDRLVVQSQATRPHMAAAALRDHRGAKPFERPLVEIRQSRPSSAGLTSLLTVTDMSSTSTTSALMRTVRPAEVTPVSSGRRTTQVPRPSRITLNLASLPGPVHGRNPSAAKAGFGAAVRRLMLVYISAHPEQPYGHRLLSDRLHQGRGVPCVIRLRVSNPRLRGRLPQRGARSGGY